MILSKGMEDAGVPVEVQVTREWPSADLLSKQDALVIYADGWGAHPANGHVAELKKFMDAGGGLTVIHWATGLGSPEAGNKKKDQRVDPVRRQWRNLVGADFEPWHSVSRFWDASFEKLPDHPVTRGVPPFVVHDECYFHLRCDDPEHAHVTPLHGAVPPVSIIHPGRAMDSGSVSAVEAVKKGEEQYCAWGFERPDGGRAFGFTGGHTHWNWGRDELRMLILNGIYWCAGGEVPGSGFHTQRPRTEEMLEHLKGNPGWTPEALQIALDRAGNGELIKWGRYGGGPLPFGKVQAKPGGGGPGLVVEGEKMKVVKQAGTSLVQAMSSFGADVWSGNAQLWWRDGKPGDVLELEFLVEKEGKYEVHLAGTKAVDYGVHSLLLNGEPLAKPVDFYQPTGVSHTGDLKLGVAALKKGANRFQIGIEGANPKAVKNYMFGIDYLRLIEVKGTQTLFDGTSLKGWEGDPKYWSVEEGALVGRISEGKTLGHNEFLWWEGEVHDFELLMKCRIAGHATANSGVQIRSEKRADGQAAGYQADFDDGKEWFGRIYDEHGRALLAERGVKVVIDEGGERQATSFRKADEYRAVAKKEGWNEYVIRALGPRIQTWINGELASDLTDRQLGQHDYSGKVAIQLHSGPGPVKVEFKDLVLLDLGKTKQPKASGSGRLLRSGIVPEGRNLGFEDGTLKGWKVEGEVWKGGPVEGDTVTPRRPGQASKHDGEFWVGGYERTRTDKGQGVLTSDAFKVTHPWGSFLVGGGPNPETRVELVEAASGKVFFAARGKQLEDMDVAVAELKGQLGKEIRVRVVDESSGAWGHINYDDFRFHEKRPSGHRAGAALVRHSNPLLGHLVPNPGEHENQTVGGMMVPKGFKVDLIAQEPELTQPIAFTFDERGRVWVVEAHSYPARQPKGKGKDRIVILEDGDHDGSFEKRTVFAKGLNLVSGIEVGFGGVWVGAAPELLFIADKNGDDVPDGDPAVLLDGWGLQDTHETLNSFTWGPDGWLYGNQGVFCHSRIGKPRTAELDRTEMRAGVWRYHPTRHEFEVFAHGCSNQWGIDFNERGHMFITHCRSAWGGGPTTFVVQNGHYWNQSNSGHAPFVAAGKAGWNPGGGTVFRNFLPSSARYGHGEGGAGKAGSRALYGGHSHVGTMIYLGDNWPEEYRDHLFTHNLHGRQMNQQINKRLGSGYETVHAGYDQLYVADTRFMGVELKYGPDGAVYMIDWQDQQHCHSANVAVWDRTDGGMYRMSWEETYEPEKVDLGKATSEELVGRLFDRNEWYSRMARRLLQERGDKEVVRKLQDDLLTAQGSHHVLRAAWALHSMGAEVPRSLLAHQNEHVRAWAIRLRAQAGALPMKEALDLCANDDSGLVRLALASAMNSLEPEDCWKVAEALAKRSEDKSDIYLPKMIWFGLGPLAWADPERGARLAATTELDMLADSIVWYLTGSAQGRDALVNYLLNANTERLSRHLNLMASSISSTQQLPAPGGWTKLVGRRAADNSAAFDRLGALFGDEEVAQRMAKTLADQAASLVQRKEAFAFLSGRNNPKLSAVYLSLLEEEAFRAEVIPLLGRYNSEEVASALLTMFPTLEGRDRLNALNAFSSQPVLAGAYLNSIKKSGKKAQSGLTALHLRQMRALNERPVNELLDGLWGKLNESSADAVAAFAKYRKIVQAAKASDVAAGKEVYATLCAVCHVRDGEGGALGPDLSGSWRNGSDYFLESIVDPNAVIGENFQLNIVTRKDGTVVSGMPAAETEKELSIQTLTEVVAIPKDSIKTRQVLPQSMMPAGLLDALTAKQVGDLIRYLTAE